MRTMTNCVKKRLKNSLTQDAITLLLVQKGWVGETSKFMKPWHTAQTNAAYNRSRPLPK